MALSSELLLQIVELVAIPSNRDNYYMDHEPIPDAFCADLNSISICSRSLYNIANPILYRRAVRPASMAFTLLQHPNLASLVQEVYVTEDNIWEQVRDEDLTIYSESEWRKKKCPKSPCAVAMVNDAIAAFFCGKRPLHNLSFYLAPETRESDVFYWLGSLCLALCRNVKHVRIWSSDCPYFDLPTPTAIQIWTLSTLQTIEFTVIGNEDLPFNGLAPYLGYVFSTAHNLKGIYIGKSGKAFQFGPCLSETVTDVDLACCTILPPTVSGIFKLFTNLERLSLSFCSTYELWTSYQHNEAPADVEIVPADYFRKASCAQKLKYLRIRELEFGYYEIDALSFKAFPALEEVSLDNMGHSLYPHGTIRDYEEFFPSTIRKIHFFMGCKERWDVSALAHAKHKMPKLATVGLDFPELDKDEFSLMRSVFESVGVSLTISHRAEGSFSKMGIVELPERSFNAAL